MRDPEFIQLRNRFLLAVFITILFIIPMSLFLYNKFANKPSDIINSINNNETFLVLVVENKCSYCKDIEKNLKDKSINYYLLNRYTDENYQKILKKLGLSKDEITVPSILYIKDGDLYSKLVNITDEDLEMFIEYNEL